MDRVLQGTEAAVRLTTYVSGVPTDPDAPPAIRVVREDGTEADTGTATILAGTGVSEAVLSPDLTAELDRLTVEWDATVGGDAQTFTTEVEIVGGFHFSLVQARALDPLGDTDLYPDAVLLSGRTAVEEALEDAAGCAFVPRYGRARIDGDGRDTLFLPDAPVLRLISVEIDGEAVDDVEIDDSEAGTLYREDGFDCGRRNVVVKYVHGYSHAPGRVPRASLGLLRHALVDSPVDDRAISTTNEDGNVQTFVQAGIRGAIFALPEANAVVRQYRSPEVV